MKPRKQPEPTKAEAGATDKKDGASLSVGGDKKDGSNAATTPENPSDEGIPSVPFEPEMLPHLDMSEQEIGIWDVFKNYIKQLRFIHKNISRFLTCFPSIQFSFFQ